MGIASTMFTRTGIIWLVIAVACAKYMIEVIGCTFSYHVTVSSRYISSLVFILFMRSNDLLKFPCLRRCVLHTDLYTNQ